MTALTRQENGHRLSIQHHLDGGREQLESDVVIFATGYRAVQPAFLAPLSHRLHLDRDEAFCINNDFTLEWDGPQSNRLFAVNAGMHRLGIAEPQLSLMAWRAREFLIARTPTSRLSWLPHPALSTGAAPPARRTARFLNR